MSPLRRAAPPVAALLLGMFCAVFTAMTGVEAAETAPDGMVNEGTALFEEGRHEEAEKVFRSAAEKSPSPERVMRRLGELWVQEAHGALKRDSLYEAKRYAEKAAEAAPGEADNHFLLAIVLFRQMNFTYARLVLREVLALDGERYGAMALLGDIHYQEGRLEEALTRWEEAQSRGHHPKALERKISRVKRELAAEEGFSREVSRNFTVRYEDPVPRAVIRTVTWHLEKSYRSLEDDLQSSPSGDIQVILYSRRDFHEITGRPEWVGGTYDGKIRLPVGGLETETAAAALFPILTHELAHAFLRTIVNRRLPLWFEEGLADYFAGMTIERAEAWLRHHGDTGHESFESLVEGLQGRRGSVEDAYVASALAVSKLVEIHGLPAVRAILEEVGAGRPFVAALEEETELSYGEYERLWKDSLP